jgi:hypothetical protein
VEPLVVCTTIPGAGIAGIVFQALILAGSHGDALAKMQLCVDTLPAGTLVSLNCQETTLQQHYASQMQSMPTGARYICDSVYFKNEADFAALCKKAFLEFPQGQSLVYWEPMYPVSRRPLPDMAFSVQADNYLALYAIYEDADQDEAQHARVQSFIRDWETHTVGTFVADADPPVRKASYWSADARERLMRIRTRWDPNHLFGGLLLLETEDRKPVQSDTAADKGLGSVHNVEAPIDT